MRLRDIVHSADLAMRHAGGLDASGLSLIIDRGDATLFRIAVIGEAVSHLPAEVQALAPEFPWNDGYWQVDFRIVVETIAIDIEPLKAAASRLILFIEPNDQ